MPFLLFNLSVVSSFQGTSENRVGGGGDGAMSLLSYTGNRNSTGPGHPACHTHPPSMLEGADALCFSSLTTFQVLPF
jgi:hypothetical protein